MSRGETGWKLQKAHLLQARSYLRDMDNSLDEYEPWGFPNEENILNAIAENSALIERMINEMIGMNTIDMFEAPEIEEPDAPEDPNI